MKDYLVSKYGALVKAMDESKSLDDESQKELSEAIVDWKKNGTY